MQDRLNELRQRFAAIAHSKWVACPKRADYIIGKWAEDDNKYEIKVPPQLRDQVIDLQNLMYAQMQIIDRMYKALEEKVGNVERLIK